MRFAPAGPARRISSPTSFVPGLKFHKRSPVVFSKTVVAPAGTLAKNVPTHATPTHQSLLGHFII
jgi:hypothetical protein